MTVRLAVTLCMLSTSAGGLVTEQPSGTRSLLFHFEWAGAAADFGGFVDTEGHVAVAPGLGPIAAAISPWAEEAQRIEAGQAFTIRYPKRVVGFGWVRSVETTGAADGLGAVLR